MRKTITKLTLLTVLLSLFVLSHVEAVQSLLPLCAIVRGQCVTFRCSTLCNQPGGVCGCTQ
jgi:hypothetical protein